MKKLKTILIILVLTGMLFTLAGCTVYTVESSAETAKQFILVSDETGFDVVCHKKTKVMYAISNYGVVTLLVDAEGKPLLYEEE